jgi:sarcosine oxidase
LIYDAIVVGLGGMGSAAAYQLAGRKKRVLGLEMFFPAHALSAKPTSRIRPTYRS